MSNVISFMQWVLVRHENPEKFESNRSELIKSLKRCYCEHREYIGRPTREKSWPVWYMRTGSSRRALTMEILKNLWASPAANDQLRRRNLAAEFLPSDISENIEQLEGNLL